MNPHPTPRPGQVVTATSQLPLYRRISRAYLIALSISAVICVLGFSVFHLAAADLRSGPAVLSRIAQMQVVSLRAALLARQMLAADAPAEKAEARGRLLQARDRMLTFHRIAGKAGGDLSVDDEIRRFATLIERGVDAYAEDHPASNAAVAEFHFLAGAELPAALERIAAHFQSAMQQRISLIDRGMAVWAILLLIALILQGLFLFRPMAHSVTRRTVELLESKAKVEHASLHDMLTNLPNRRQCALQLERAIASARRTGKRVAILHIDLDRFKTINDTFGHAVGDAVLVSAARRFERSVRRGDTVARLGGDEFVIIAPIESDPTEAARIATRILNKMDRPIQSGDSTITTAASIGISIFPDDETDPAQLLINADIALYRAKEGGRGRMSFFSPEMRRNFEEREAIERDLRRGIANDEFEVHFQPQVRDDSGSVVGMEALVRWRHPEKGLLPAEDFMQVAESSGLIVPIGKCVIDSALAAAGAWNRDGLDYGVVSINVAQQQIRESDFVAFLRDCMECHGVDAEKISVEVMEAMLTDRRNEGVDKMIEQLQLLGVTVELDDFGTGYAALNHLKRYKINRLKIDRTFVGAIGTQTQNIQLIKTLVDVARNFGIDVLAEGVETEAQRTFLNALGCMQVQGYQIARPMGFEEAGAWLATRAGVAAGLPASA